jgi:hypothetical protein
MDSHSANGASLFCINLFGPEYSMMVEGGCHLWCGDPVPPPPEPFFPPPPFAPGPPPPGWDGRENQAPEPLGWSLQAGTPIIDWIDPAGGSIYGILPALPIGYYCEYNHKEDVDVDGDPHFPGCGSGLPPQVIITVVCAPPPS